MGRAAKMSDQLEVTGGARIGWVNATWPLAKLSASAQQLSVSGLLVGRYSFSPDQVAALEPYGSIPILSSGVRIVHTVQTYPDKIIFWCFGSPKRLIENITALGFQPRASRTQVPKRDGMAFRWSFLILLVVIWNALFLIDGFVPWNQPKGPGLYTLLAVALLFLTAAALNVSDRFQALVLKPGRSITEVRSVVLLVLFVSAILLIVFGAQQVAS
jgi:hypothetical protein